MLNRSVRIAGLILVAGFALFALALLAVRFVVFPRVESYREALTATLSRQLGQPVEIAAITTGWDGWNPKLVVQGFRVRDRARASEVPLLELPEVDLIVAWTSLTFLELRLKQLVIERPRLAIRRDPAGLLHVAGIEIDPAQASEDSPVVDWILRQHQIVIRDALITWNDDLRNAPQLVLDRVQFRLENSFGHHRFGLRGTPPSELAAPLDVRGDIHGGSLKEWQHALGRVYIRLDYADVEAWREWLPLPVAITSGKGALRVWFQFGGGEAREIVADLELADVKAKLEERLPELDLAHLSGRVGWRYADRRREVFTRDLAFVTARGQRLDPTNFSLVLQDAADGRLPTGRVEFDRLQIEPLRELAAHLPLPENWRANLARFAPRGTLARGRLRWDGKPEAPSAYTATAEFADLGVVAQDALPGGSRFTGSFDAHETGGQVNIATRNGALELPRVFADPIPLDSLQGIVTWEHKGGRTRIEMRKLEFASAQSSGSLTGTYRTAPQGPGEIDLSAQLTRANVAQVHRYLPRSTGDEVRSWLRAGLGKGDLSDARLKVSGNLADFPFADGKGGQFLFTAKAKGATLRYAKGWPTLEDVDADLRFEGASMTIDATRGRTFAVQVGRTLAVIRDVRVDVPRLTVDGSAAGPMADFLRFVDESPLAAHMAHFTEGATATGNGHLTLKLDLPLGKAESNSFAGEFTFANAQVRLPGVPALSQVNGKIDFAETGLQARELAAEILGGPAKLALAGADGRLRVTGGGLANVASLQREFGTAYLEHFAGSTDWTTTVDVVPGNATWALESSMKGVVVDLPAPLGKTAAEVIPLRVERHAELERPDEDRIDVTYGRAVQLAAHRRLDRDHMDLDRALLSLGRAAGRADAARAERPGLWVRGELPVLNVDDWLALRERRKPTEAAGADDGPALGGVDLEVDNLEVLGRRFSEFKVVARKPSSEWNLDVAGREIAGTATWSAPGGSTPNGRIVARLARLAMPPAGDLVPWSGADKAPDPKAVPSAASPWPEIDITAESFASKGHDLGRLELVAQPRGAEWRIEKLRLSSDSGRIDASGAWRTVGRRQQTKLDVALDAKDAGGFLARFGYPGAIQGAPTTINGQLAWAGAPTEFDYPTLNGAFRIEVGPGRFTKIEPGIGKLLGVLSLQALPRRISLDFQDIFSDGFAFDEVTGNVRVVNGVMNSDDLRLVGPAAKVDIAGDADLARETQRLTVRVQPALSTSVSAGAALLFLANPIIGAAIGAGSLLAQKVFKDPIEQLFSYQYAVTGGWSDPVVTRSGTATASFAPGAPAAAGEGASK